MGKINAGNYSVYSSEEALSELHLFLKREEYLNAKKFIFVDENTMEHCYADFMFYADQLQHAEVIQTESGEENKNLETCYQVWKVLSEMKADRQALIIILGGGVLCDMGGFIASTFKRGIRFIHVPTTLLAMVDASIGGKLAVDLDGLKNQIGVFNTPEAVFVNSNFIKTLPDEQILSGYAEIIKHALIRDVEYLKFLIRKIPNVTVLLDKNTNLEAIISRSIEIKNEIVLHDFKENSIRKNLNFGHTVGHAVESFFLLNGEAKLLHGEAVAIGIVCELYLSTLEYSIDPLKLETVINYMFSIYRFQPLPEEIFDDLIDLMANDKKNENDSIHFVLLEDIGKAKYGFSFDQETIKESLAFYNKLCNSVKEI